MIEIRPVWNVALRNKDDLPSQIAALLAVEERIVSASEVYLNIAKNLLDREYVDELTSLMRSAHRDLAGGCEMARTGYLKQAYSLWRSWFEQAIFFLYFLEAPLHKAAWQVKAEINVDDSPQYRLMLHQLLADSGEKHPFAIVYDARYTILNAALQIGSIPKQKRPIQRAARVLTLLSQGVHGTYQPQSAENIEGLCVQLDTHCKPVLVAAEEVLNTLWILLITSLIALPHDVLVKMRDGSVQPQVLIDAGIDEADTVAKLAPFFALAFPFPPPQAIHG